MDKKEMKKFFIIQYVIIALLLVLCLVLIFDKKEAKDSGVVKENISEDYDVSNMNDVSVSDVLEMFEDKKSHVLYIGRESCSVCKAILPNLQAAQDDLDYVTDYLDITTVDRNSDDWNKLEKLLNLETSINVTNADGKAEVKTETFGYFIGTYGYTPSIIIINNNKMIAGHIGNYSLDDLLSWLQSHGI